MNFDLFNVPRIVFGGGVFSRLPEFVPASARVLLVYNGKRPEVASVAEHRQRGEPTVDDVDRALAVARAAKCDIVIAVGGGSAIDAGKAVAGLLSNGGAATDYMEVVGKGQKITKPAVPWIAIPTTAGTGAEVTRNAVVGWPEKKFKASLRSELLMARVAIIDPELAVDVPPEVTARSGADALCQCIEAFVSRGANLLTDAIAIKGVEVAGRYLKRAFDDGHDLEAREGMAMSALISGISLTNAGLGAVHGFAAPLGANFPVPHGTVCGVLLPDVIEANRRHGVEKYGAIDDALGGDAAAVCAQLVSVLKLPSLGVYGIGERDIPTMVELAKRASSMRFNPVALDDETLGEILQRAIGDAVRVRDFQPADAEAFRVLNEAWLNKYFHVEPKDIKVLSDPQAQIIGPGGTILILEMAGQTVGCCALVKLPNDTFEVAKMAIAEGQQSRGLGRKLLVAAISRAKTMGAKRLYLESNSRLAPALRLYKSVGFTDVPAEQRPASVYQRVDVWMEMRL